MTIRSSGLLRPALAALVTLAAILLTHRAGAAEEVSVMVNNGQVIVTAKGGWHINKSYPWKLIVGETKLDASKFTLSDQSAKVTAPKGTGKLKGGVCNGDECRMFQESVTIP